MFYVKQYAQCPRKLRKQGSYLQEDHNEVGGEADEYYRT